MKHPNPVRGHIACPVCNTSSTVHCVGEGELIATGNAPKNKRNAGLKYYKCPSCGNSSISKKVDEYINANLNAEPLPDEQKEANEKIFEALEKTESVAPLTLVEEVAQASDINAQSAIETVSEPTIKAPVFTMKRVAMALALLAFLLWSVGQLMPKKAKGALNGN